jgi:hypothetical protein
MARNLLEIGQRLIISNRRSSVRRGFVLIMANLFLLAGLVFAVEIALILLGIGNIILPWTRQALDFLNRLVF